jgi:hypothetical protein
VLCLSKTCAHFTLAALLLVGRAAAQDLACRQSLIAVNVSDERGFPVAGLSVSNFRAELRGKPLKILALSVDKRPRRIAVLLDASESIRSNSTGKWDLAQEIAQHFVQNGPPDAQISFDIVGSGSPRMLRPLDTKDVTFGSRSLGELLQGLPAVGPGERRGALFDVIHQGLTRIEKPQFGDVVYLVTDGDEEGSKRKPAEIQKELAQYGVRVFAVTLPMIRDLEFAVIRPGTTDSQFEAQHETTDFRDTISGSGGHIFRVRPNRRTNEWGFHFDEKERVALATSLQLLYVEMIQFYRLDLEVAAPLREPTNWKLELRLPAELAKKSLRVTYPAKLFPCANGGRER